MAVPFQRDPKAENKFILELSTIHPLLGAWAFEQIRGDKFRSIDWVKDELVRLVGKSGRS
jgi:hypothetical protein